MGKNHHQMVYVESLLYQFLYYFITLQFDLKQLNLSMILDACDFLILFERKEEESERENEREKGRERGRERKIERDERKAIKIK